MKSKKYIKNSTQETCDTKPGMKQLVWVLTIQASLTSSGQILIFLLCTVVPPQNTSGRPHAFRYRVDRLLSTVIAADMEAIYISVFILAIFAPVSQHSRNQ